MKNITLASDKLSLKTALNYKLGLFVKGFTSALFLAAMLVLVGILLKFTHLAGEHIVFMFAMFVLAFLFLLQIALSFVYVFSHPKLAFLGAFSSLTFVLACITLIFAYESWWGMNIMIILTLPLLLLSFAFLLGYFIMGEHRHTTHRKFLYVNILLPYLFISLLWLAYLIRDEVRERREERTPIARKELVLQPFVRG